MERYIRYPSDSFLYERSIQIACYSKSILFFLAFYHCICLNIPNIIGLSISCHWLFLTSHLKNKEIKSFIPTTIFEMPVSRYPVQVRNKLMANLIIIADFPNAYWRNTVIACFNCSASLTKENNRQIGIGLKNFCNNICLSLKFVWTRQQTPDTSVNKVAFVKNTL